MKLSNFSDVERLLEAYIPNVRSVREAYSMVRMEPLMRLLGNPEKELKIIHVAGTSGKTSTCYYIAELLRTTGIKVGLTVSPHIDCINERLQIDTVPLDEETYIRCFKEFIGIVESSHIEPTYFELLIAFAYWTFAKMGVDYAVVEVGVGGLLDSTNVAARADKVCVITDIGQDHSNVLGKTIESITSHKAGIIRHHNTVFMYKQSDEIMDVVREVVQQQQAELHEILTPQSETPAHLPLFQKRNWYLAQLVVTYIINRDGLKELTKDGVNESTHILVPARMEILSVGGKTIVLDGAHNAQKMTALVKSLKVAFPRKNFGVMFSLIQNKNARLDGTLDALLTLRPKLIITSFKSDASGMRGSMSPIKIAEHAHMKGYDNWQTIASPREALQELLKLECDVLVITGSFYLMNNVRTWLRQPS